MVRGKIKKIERGDGIQQKYFWAVVRISVGFIFLWAFFDKLFGLSFGTIPAKAWIRGGSPTAGFLAHATQGPFVSIFHSLASSGLVSWLFMLGLLFVGLTMILGIGMRLGAIAGTAMLFFIWLSLLPPSNNPFMDYHWFFAFALIASVITKAGNYCGLGKYWSSLEIVKKYPILE